MFVTDEIRLIEIRNRLREVDGYFEQHFEEIYCLRQEEADILRPKEAVDFPVVKWSVDVPISYFEIGHYIRWFGVIGRVEKIKIYHGEYSPVMPIYILKCSYVGGDFDFYNRAISKSINGGSANGYLFEVSSSDLFNQTMCYL